MKWHGITCRLSVQVLKVKCIYVVKFCYYYFFSSWPITLFVSCDNPCILWYNVEFFFQLQREFFLMNRELNSDIISENWTEMLLKLKEKFKQEGYSNLLCASYLQFWWFTYFMFNDQLTTISGNLNKILTRFGSAFARYCTLNTKFSTLKLIHRVNCNRSSKLI